MRSTRSTRQFTIEQAFLAALDEYLRRFAAQHRRKGVNTVYVPIDTELPGTIPGY